MAFKSEALAEKLSKLNATQQSIETTSQWCIFYRKDAKKVVETWSTEFQRSNDANKKLAMVYLANDILQNSRKKGAQFVVEFYHKLPPAINQLVKHGDSKTQSSMMRMIQVWEERRVFGGSGVKPFLDAVNGTAKPGQRHVVLQSAHPSAERLMVATREATEAHERSRALLERCPPPGQDPNGNGREELTSGLKTLQQHAVALQNEIGHYDRILSILQQLTSQQEEAKRLAEQQLDGCQQATQQYQHLLRNCQEAETTALQDTLHRPSAEPRREAVPAPPVEDGLHQPPQTPNDVPGPPDSKPSDASAMGQLLTGLSQGGVGQVSTAADLVAQLSQSGASAQMLIDAISALPQVDQISELAPQPTGEEEYDPELGE